MGKTNLLKLHFDLEQSPSAYSFCIYLRDIQLPVTAIFGIWNGFWPLHSQRYRQKTYTLLRFVVTSILDYNSIYNFIVSIQFPFKVLHFYLKIFIHENIYMTGKKRKKNMKRQINCEYVNGGSFLNNSHLEVVWNLQRNSVLRYNIPSFFPYTEQTSKQKKHNITKAINVRVGPSHSQY